MTETERRALDGTVDNVASLTRVVEMQLTLLGIQKSSLVELAIRMKTLEDAYAILTGEASARR